ncbi:MAG: MFS transporter [Aliidongia sp.]
MVPRIRGERALTLIWAGQLIAILGSSLTGFGLSLHMYDTTGSVPMMTALQFAAVAPQVYLSLFAGVFIDRFGIKRVMALATLAGSLIPALLAIVLGLGPLPAWLVLCAAAGSGSAAAFRDTALQASVPGFVRPARLAAANGMIATAIGVPYVLGPSVAAILLSYFSFRVILIADAASVLIATLAVLAVRFPVLPLLGDGQGLVIRLGQGARWVLANRSLAWLSAYFSLSYFFNGAAAGLTAAYVLLQTGGDKTALATVNTLLALGLIAGGSVAGPVSRRAPPLKAIALSCGATSLGRVAFGLVMGPVAWGACQFVRAAGLTVAGAANDLVWQRAVPEGWRGRVFGTRKMLMGGLYPVALGVGGTVGAIAAQFGAGSLAACFVVFGLLEASTLLLLLRVRTGATALIPAE